jgi:glutamate synthase domain-containing protein 2
MKMKDQNISVLNDLNALVVNIKKYRKKDRKIILKLVISFLEQNISLNNSNANIDEIKEEI